jgi:hypothetical protein
MAHVRNTSLPPVPKVSTAQDDPPAPSCSPHAMSAAPGPVPGVWRGPGVALSVALFGRATPPEGGSPLLIVAPWPYRGSPRGSPVALLTLGHSGGRGSVAPVLHRHGAKGHTPKPRHITPRQKSTDHHQDTPTPGDTPGDKLQHQDTPPTPATHTHTPPPPHRHTGSPAT